MLKHTISGSGGLGRQQQQHVISGDPRGNTSSLFHNDHHPPPTIPRTLPGPYNNRPLPPSMNHSFPGTVHHNRSFNNGNPYSNTSTLSNSKHSNGGTSISISPLGGLSNGGLHLSRLPPPPTSTNYAEALTPRLGVTTGPYVNQLNASTLSTSKHSLGGGSSSVSPLGPPRIANGGFNLSSTGGGGGRPPSRRGPPPANSIVVSPSSYIDGRPPTTTPVSVVAGGSGRHDSNGVREMLTSLGLLCLVSLLLALLSLVFMLKISPVTAADVKDFLRSDQVTVISPDEYVLVYEVTLALCALSLSLNLCCLLVCAVQFLFAVKLVRDSPDGERTNEYLKKSAFTRVCAVGGFFVSIPVFLTGIILYTFIQFHSTPAVITSALIGLGIIFCGCAMVHNVFVWQKEKTNAVRTLAQQQRLALHEQSLVDQSSRSLSHQTFIRHSSMNNGSVSPGPIHIPQTSLDNSATPTPPEICTLV